MPPTPLEEFRLECLKSVLQNAQDSYKELARVTGIIEDKAQKAGALAGVFLAVALGFVGPDKIHALAVAEGLSFLIFVLFVIGVFVASIAVCLSVMWTSAAPVPLSLENLDLIVRDLLRVTGGEFNSGVREAFLGEQIDLWKKIVEGQRSRNGKKAKLLRVAQWLLSAGMILTACAISFIIFSEIRSVPVL